MLWPHGSKWLSVDRSACSWIGVVIPHDCACLWIGVGFGVGAYRRGMEWVFLARGLEWVLALGRIGMVGFSFGLLYFRFVVGLFCGGSGFVLVVAMLE